MMAREFLEHVAYEAMEKTVFADSTYHQTVMRNGTNTLAQRYASNTASNTGNRNFAHPGVQRPSPNRASPMRTSKSVDSTSQHSGQNGSLHNDAAQDGFFNIVMGLFRKGKKGRNNSNGSIDGVTNRTSEQNKDGAGHTDNTELDSYEVVENIELSHMNGFVMNSKGEVGRGHNFVCLQLENPTWCDNCGEFIWGVCKQCLICKYCQYTCHHRCRQNVTLDCSRTTPEGAVKEAASKEHDDEEPLFSQDTETTLSQLDDGDSGYHTQGSTLLNSTPSESTLSCEDLKKRIEEINEEAQGLQLKISEGTDFEGFIRVNMNLMRPINMSIGQRPPSIYEMLTSGGTAERENTKTTSFYLPRDTIKALHISSLTTAQEVITALLNKYQITDNPRKFALYEQTCGNDKKVMMRKIIDHEHPLVICLNWKPEDIDRKKFVLQENDTGEIVWEAFSVPELHNFLRILDREEAEYVEQVKSKYYLLRFHMEHRMKELKKEEAERRKELASSDARKPVFV